MERRGHGVFFGRERVRRFQTACGAFLCLALWTGTVCVGAVGAVGAVGFNSGDLVRLTRSETLLFKGENYKPAPKNQEFSVLKYDPAQKLVYVPYYKEDGSVVAVTVPSEALEGVVRDGWGELV